MSSNSEPPPWPTLRLRNPFVLRYTQIITGIGVGCGVGVGVGIPLPLGSLAGGAQIPTGDITRYINKARRFVQPLIKKAGIKRLDAGIGCGVGVGHGFALVGLGLKPGVTEELTQFMQDGFKALMSRVQSQTGALPNVEGSSGPLANLSASTPAISSSVPAQVPGLSLSNAGLGGIATGYMSKAGFQVNPGPTMAPQQNGKNDEIERLKLEKEVLQTLLRQQKQIDDLREEVKSLQEGTQSLRPSLASSRPSLASSTVEIYDESLKATQCFDCRRKNRKH